MIGEGGGAQKVSTLGRVQNVLPQNSLSGKTQGIWKIHQNTGNLFAQVVNFLILKVSHIANFAAKISNLFG